MNLFHANKPILCGLALIFFSGCQFFTLSDSVTAPVIPDGYDEGSLITDSIVVIDDFHFSEANCSDLIPAGFANQPKPDYSPAPMVVVNSIACYSAKVVILNSAHAPVDSFSQAFGIWGQRDGEKERGHIGYLVWNPDASLLRSERQTYTWQIRFDFGANQILKLRVLVDWPRP